MARAWTLPLLGCLVAPLITWLPMLALRYPWLPLPQYPAPAGVDLWQMQTFYLVAFLLIALLVARDDRWLAAAIVLAGVAVFRRGAYLDPTHSMLFGLGALGLWAMRRTPPGAMPLIRRALVSLGVVQIVYVLLQGVLGYDPLWGRLFGFPSTSVIQPLGTLGIVDAAGAYIAITAPLMPVWALPFAGWAVWQGHSLGAFGALTLGLLVRYLPLLIRQLLFPFLAGLVVFTAPLFLVSLLIVKGISVTAMARIVVWGFGLKQAALSDPVLGWGLGGWAQRVPALQAQMGVMPSGEVFREAHSEPVQWLCEMGVVGLVILAGWCWHHRRMFADARWGASLAALAADSLTFFPLHVGAIALLAIVLVGVATPAPASPDPLTGGVSCPS